VRNRTVLLHKGNLNFLAEQVNIGEMNTALLLEYSARTPTALFDIFTISLYSMRENPGNDLELTTSTLIPCNHSSLVTIILLLLLLLLLLLTFIQSSQSYSDSKHVKYVISIKCNNTTLE